MDTWVKTMDIGDVHAKKKGVSILVLMDTWVKTKQEGIEEERARSFNPCFNGYMGKDNQQTITEAWMKTVSILVLMDTWVKTSRFTLNYAKRGRFQSLF